MAIHMTNSQKNGSNNPNNSPNPNNSHNTNNNHTNTATRHVEIAIIGAGTAGNSAYRQLREQTDSIVIINDGYWTTTCATVGCMPSKLLIAAAKRAYYAKQSNEFGVIADVKIDGKMVMQRVQKERDRFAQFVQNNVDGWDNHDKINGRAGIDANGLIRVNDERIQAERIIIATGSTPFVPDGWQESLGERLLTSDGVFELSDLPKSLAVVGAGAIGLELAQAFHRLGVTVRLFNRTDNLGGLQDNKVNAKAIACLSKELDMALNSDIQAVKLIDEQEQKQVQIDYTDTNGDQQQFTCDYLLAATGRRNQLSNLGIEHLGVELDDKGRPKQHNKLTGQIANLPVYVIGDANGYLPLLHVASTEGYMAGLQIKADINKEKNDGDNLAKQKDTISKLDTPISIVFSEPQIAQLGKSLSEIDDENLAYVVSEVSFDNQGRSRVMGVNCGLLRLYVCKKSDCVLGASMVAPDAEYIAHLLTYAINHDLSLYSLLNTPFYHPTILEGLRTALREAQAQMQLPYFDNPSASD